MKNLIEKIETVEIAKQPIKYKLKMQIRMIEEVCEIDVFFKFQWKIPKINWNLEI